TWPSTPGAQISRLTNWGLLFSQVLSTLERYERLAGRHSTAAGQYADGAMRQALAAVDRCVYPAGLTPATDAAARIIGEPNCWPDFKGTTLEIVDVIERIRPAVADEPVVCVTGLVDLLRPPVQDLFLRIEQYRRWVADTEGRVQVIPADTATHTGVETAP